MDNIVVAQILEAKYLPNTLPLYAKKHFRPSYSWSSIFLARDLQLDGTLQQIGDGALVRIQDGNWVPGFSVFPYPEGLDPNEHNLDVTNLINQADR